MQVRVESQAADAYVTKSPGIITSTNFNLLNKLVPLQLESGVHATGKSSYRSPGVPVASLDSGKKSDLIAQCSPRSRTLSLKLIDILSKSIDSY
jgi:hypothetical protein